MGNAALRSWRTFPSFISGQDAMQPPFQIDLYPPLLVVRFTETQNILGWSIAKPGFGMAREVVWLEVRDDDLPLHVDPQAYLMERLSSHGLSDAAAFMTSREIRRYHVEQSEVGGVAATCVTTVGLSNGERIGVRLRQNDHRFGTINTLVHVSRSLSPGAFVEAISIAAQARTAAIVETNHFRDGPGITGTGTDCIIIAAPPNDEPATSAGLHTDLGEAIGAAVYGATYEGARTWSVDTTTNKTTACSGG